LDHALSLVSLAYIRLDKQGVIDLLGGSLASPRVPFGDYNARPLACKALADGKPDPTASPADNRDFIRKSHMICLGFLTIPISCL
jgi:hypothetical protein